MTVQHQGRSRFEYHIVARGFTKQSFANPDNPLIQQIVQRVAREGLGDYTTVYERYRGLLSSYEFMLVGVELNKRFTVYYVKIRPLLTGLVLGRFMGNSARDYRGRFDEDRGEPLDDDARKILKV